MKSPEDRRQSPVTGHRSGGSDASVPSPAGEAGSADAIYDAELVDEIVILEAGPTAHELGLELPDDPDEAQALLLRELSEARQEAGEQLEMLQRVAADFDNYRRRVERDQAENVERASQRVIESLLPTLDAFDAATAFEPQTPAEQNTLDGMISTRSQLLETLAREGFEPIEAAGELFDPKVHEAVSGPSDGEGDLVVDTELRRGYVMRGRVIRPSLVTVKHA
jgi:molecular chaperone GrpE